MGNYELDIFKEENEMGYFLHYTGDCWQTIELTEHEAFLFVEGIMTGFDLFNDGRMVF